MCSRRERRNGLNGKSSSVRTISGSIDKRKRMGEKKEMWKILQSMYGQEELSKIEIDDTPAMMVERMAEIIAQKAENGAISVFVIDEVPMMTSRKNFADRKEELRYMIGLLGNCEKKEHVVIVAVIPVSKYCTEMQKKKEVSTCYGEIEKPENCLVFV